MCATHQDPRVYSWVEPNLPANLRGPIPLTTTQEGAGGLTVFKSVCPLDCPDTCSMLVTVKDGVAVELRGDPDHRFTRGFLCQKMARYLERVYSPDRLLQPLRRIGRKGEGRFEPTTWEDALTEIAGRFAAIANSADGPQAILPYSYCGTMGKLQSSSLDRRFFHRLGASKLDRSICASAGGIGYEYTMGRGRLGRRSHGCSEVQIHRQLGLEHRQHE